MPPYPGEERILTLFADCHYYFALPTARPTVHRFDKASYFYVYWNSTKRTSRIEVANNAGTPDQDAFSGRLDTCRILNSMKFPTLVTLIVDAMNDASSPTSPKPGRDPEDWYLSGADPRATNQMKYKLHTVDFYFWTQEDAQQVTDLLRKLLHPSQLDIAETRQQPQEQQQQQQQQQAQTQTRPRQSGDDISSVVQNLENVAVTDPAYSNGQTRDSRNQPQSRNTNITLPPPPPPPTQLPTMTRTAASSSVASPGPVTQPVRNGSKHASPSPERAPINYTPMAYNPAAPAAPEKIAHREKTPPPEDGEPGARLSTTTTQDQSFTHPYNPSQSWGAPPAVSRTTQSGNWGSPPPSTTPGYGSPMSPVGHASPPPTSQYQSSRTSMASGVPSFAPPPATSPPGHNQQAYDQHRHSVAAETYTPDTNFSDSSVVETPGSQFYSTIQPPQKPLQHVQPQYADYLTAGGRPGQQQQQAPHQPQPPPGGYADYSYAQDSKGRHGGHGGHSGRDSQGHSIHGGHHGSNDGYDIHNQVYRPTQNEAEAHHSKPSRSDTSTSKISNSSTFRSWKEKAKKLTDL